MSSCLVFKLLVGCKTWIQLCSDCLSQVVVVLVCLVGFIIIITQWLFCVLVMYGI